MSGAKDTAAVAQRVARDRRSRRGTWATLASRWDVLAVIAAGGALGSLARWSLAEARPAQPGRFAWATVEANVAGSLLIGVLMVLVSDVWAPSRYVRPFLGVGVLGGFTTFSTYALDANRLGAGGHQGVAVGYLIVTLVAGIAAVLVGSIGARLVVRRRRRRAARRRDVRVRATDRPGRRP